MKEGKTINKIETNEGNDIGEEIKKIKEDINLLYDQVEKIELDSKEKEEFNNIIEGDDLVELLDKGADNEKTFNELLDIYNKLLDLSKVILKTENELEVSENQTEKEVLDLGVIRFDKKSVDEQIELSEKEDDTKEGENETHKAVIVKIKSILTDSDDDNIIYEYIYGEGKKSLGKKLIKDLASRIEYSSGQLKAAIEWFKDNQKNNLQWLSEASVVENQLTEKQETKEIKRKKRPKKYELDEEADEIDVTKFKTSARGVKNKPKSESAEDEVIQIVDKVGTDKIEAPQIQELHKSKEGVVNNIPIDREIEKQKFEGLDDIYVGEYIKVPSLAIGTEFYFKNSKEDNTKLVRIVGRGDRNGFPIEVIKSNKEDEIGKSLKIEKYRLNLVKKDQKTGFWPEVPSNIVEPENIKIANLDKIQIGEIFECTQNKKTQQVKIIEIEENSLMVEVVDSKNRNEIGDTFRVKKDAIKVTDEVWQEALKSGEEQRDDRVLQRKEIAKSKDKEDFLRDKDIFSLADGKFYFDLNIARKLVDNFDQNNPKSWKDLAFTKAAFAKSKEADLEFRKAMLEVAKTLLSKDRNDLKSKDFSSRSHEKETPNDLFRYERGKIIFGEGGKFVLDFKLIKNIVKKFHTKNPDSWAKLAKSKEKFSDDENEDGEMRQTMCGIADKLERKKSYLSFEDRAEEWQGDVAEKSLDYEEREIAKRVESEKKQKNTIATDKPKEVDNGGEDVKELEEENIPDTEDVSFKIERYHNDIVKLNNLKNQGKTEVKIKTSDGKEMMIDVDRAISIKQNKINELTQEISDDRVSIKNRIEELQRRSQTVKGENKDKIAQEIIKLQEQLGEFYAPVVVEKNDSDVSGTKKESVEVNDALFGLSNDLNSAREAYYKARFERGKFKLSRLFSKSEQLEKEKLADLESGYLNMRNIFIDQQIANHVSKKLEQKLRAGQEVDPSSVQGFVRQAYVAASRFEDSKINKIFKGEIKGIRHDSIGTKLYNKWKNWGGIKGGLGKIGTGLGMNIAIKVAEFSGPVAFVASKGVSGFMAFSGYDKNFEEGRFMGIKSSAVAESFGDLSGEIIDLTKGGAKDKKGIRAEKLQNVQPDEANRMMIKIRNVAEARGVSVFDFKKLGIQKEVLDTLLKKEKEYRKNQSNKNIEFINENSDMSVEEIKVALLNKKLDLESRIRMEDERYKNERQEIDVIRRHKFNRKVASAVLAGITVVVGEKIGQYVRQSETGQKIIGWIGDKFSTIKDSVSGVKTTSTTSTYVPLRASDGHGLPPALDESVVVGSGGVSSKGTSFEGVMGGGKSSMSAEYSKTAGGGISPVAENISKYKVGGIKFNEEGAMAGLKPTETGAGIKPIKAKMDLGGGKIPKETVVSTSKTYSNFYNEPVMTDDKKMFIPDSQSAPKVAPGLTSVEQVSNIKFNKPTIDYLNDLFPETRNYPGTGFSAVSHEYATQVSQMPAKQILTGGRLPTSNPAYNEAYDKLRVHLSDIKNSGVNPKTGESVKDFLNRARKVLG